MLHPVYARDVTARGIRQKRNSRVIPINESLNSRVTRLARHLEQIISRLINVRARARIREQTIKPEISRQLSRVSLSSYRESNFRRSRYGGAAYPAERSNRSNAESSPREPTRVRRGAGLVRKRSSDL